MSNVNRALYSDNIQLDMRLDRFTQVLIKGVYKDRSSLNSWCTHLDNIFFVQSSLSVAWLYTGRERIFIGGCVKVHVY
jgi:hypothetical protein